MASRQRTTVDSKMAVCRAIRGLPGLTSACGYESLTCMQTSRVYALSKGMHMAQPALAVQPVVQPVELGVHVVNAANVHRVLCGALHQQASQHCICNLGQHDSVILCPGVYCKLDSGEPGGVYMARCTVLLLHHSGGACMWCWSWQLCLEVALRIKQLCCRCKKVFAWLWWQQ